MKNKFIILVTAIIFILAGCGSKPTLSEWLKSDDMVTMLEEANKTLAASGMTMDISADGEDILVYTYILDKAVYGDAFEGMTQEDYEASFNPTVTANAAQFDSLFTSVKEELGIELKALRFEFTMDGEVLFSKDVTK